MRYALRATVLGAVVLGVTGPAFGWGAAGHEAIVRLAAKRTIAPCLKAYFMAKLSTAVTEAMAPDRWKGFDSDEPPRHYLNIDVESDTASYPRTYADAVARYGAARALQQGLVPWRTAEFFDKLKMRFGAWDGDGAAAVAGQLGHYVGDAHSPLHATLNFDGQRTGDSGLHQRWEVDMPREYVHDLEARAAILAGSIPEPAPEPVFGVFTALATGAVLVPAIVELDIRTRGTAPAFYEAQGEMAALRWAEAAALLASLWREAYVTAGSPPLPGMPASCYPDAGVRADAGTTPRPTADAGPIAITGGEEERRISGGGGCAAAAGAPRDAGVAGVLFVLMLARRRRRS